MLSALSSAQHILVFDFRCIHVVVVVVVEKCMYHVLIVGVFLHSQVSAHDPHVSRRRPATTALFGPLFVDGVILLRLAGALHDWVGQPCLEPVERKGFRSRDRLTRLCASEDMLSHARAHMHTHSLTLTLTLTRTNSYARWSNLKLFTIRLSSYLLYVRLTVCACLCIFVCVFVYVYVYLVSI
jgi:hypothetical protein